ncbi:MAG: nascent polypeptide-associated complex protein [Candidatus Caldarchaeum sp.]|nr:nascent polypeptide-associated complex protein [Candidatus Caldarchaeum sp.]
MRRAQERMLKSLGLDIEEIGQADEVVIKLSDRVIVLKGPSVLAVKTGGEKVFQLVGGEVSEEKTAEPAPVYVPSDDDISLVVAQTGVSEEQAKNALSQSGGDLAKAILLLRSKR